MSFTETTDNELSRLFRFGTFGLFTRFQVPGTSDPLPGVCVGMAVGVRVAAGGLVGMAVGVRAATGVLVGLGAAATDWAGTIAIMINTSGTTMDRKSRLNFEIFQDVIRGPFV